MLLSVFNLEAHLHYLRIPKAFCFSGMSSVEQVLKFTQALRALKTGECLDGPDMKYNTNRGHKLELGAPFVSSRSLAITSMPEINDSEKQYMQEFGSAVEDLGIDVARILQPISDPAEVSTHPAVKRIFLNPFLKQLSDELNDIIVEEKQVLSQIVCLLEVLLGDDDLEIMPQIMANLDEPQPYPTPEPGQPLPQIQDNILKFFEKPQLKLDRDQGLEPEEAQELREKLQVVQQQMEEYVICMTRVRNSVTKSQRLRRNVLNWCREMNNEDYVKADLDEQNNFDNAGLGKQPDKDFYNTGSSSEAPSLSNGLD